MSDYKQIMEALNKAGGDDKILKDESIAHLVIEGNEVLSSHNIEGLELEAKEKSREKVVLYMVVRKGYRIKKPVHLCFGMLPEEGKQNIVMDICLEDNTSIDILAHCVFPNAVNVKHLMDASIKVGNNSDYRYRESHFHGENGGVEVDAKAKLFLGNDSLLSTTFSVLNGRAGKISIDYETEIWDNSKLEMSAKISGYEEDDIYIREAGLLKGTNSRGVLDTRIALRDKARAEIYNELTAQAPGARGHVDCTEIIQDEARAKAIPVVTVCHPEAKITHEAAIGSVDSKQLQTLMARGLDKDQAAAVIIEGLLT